MQVIVFGVPMTYKINPKDVKTVKLADGSVEIHYQGKKVAVAQADEVQNLRDLLNAV